MSEHTSGPWEAGIARMKDDAPAFGFTIRCGTKEVPLALMNVYEHNYAPEFFSEEEMIANARLMAASPDLLAIAQAVVAGGMSYPKHLRDKAAVAIAKVEGGERK